ncbi:MAG: PTS glucose transporter subunit IIA [Succinivibrio sp.]|nr:PTS glucose transporter subunit IIA [Succinivibrio sp.]
MSIFSKLFKKFDDNVPLDNADLVLFAPVSGTIVPLTEVPDVVISEKIVGDGLSIVPESDEVLAPCQCTVINVVATQNAIALHTPCGVDLYLVFGIGMDRYSIQGCKALVQPGQVLNTGTPMLKIDLPKVSETVKSTLTSLIAIRSSARIARLSSALGKVEAGKTECLWIELQKDSEEKASED